MDKPNSTMARQIAKAASAFQEQRTGHVPQAVSVVLSDDTLVTTRHEALSPAEKALSKSAAGAAQVQEFHRQLFANDSDSLRQEIKRITGVNVREATAQVETPGRGRPRASKGTSLLQSSRAIGQKKEHPCDSSTEGRCLSSRFRFVRLGSG
jgi:uncharacterized protein YbcI